MSIFSMPQTIFNYDDNIRAQNINISINSGTSILLNSISVLGINNFALTLTNYASSGSSLTNINILSSEDNAFYYFSGINVFPAGINAGQTLHYEFSATSCYLQITANTT